MARLRFARSIPLLPSLIFSTLCFAASPDRIGAINAAQKVRLSSGVAMQARSESDQGRVDPSLKLSYITLLTVPSPTQKKALDRLLAEQQNPHSSYYHKWLTPEQYADRFGLSQNDIGKLTAWLKSQGFQIVRTARGRNWIVFSGTAAQVENAFQTEIHNFKVNGEIHFANTSPPVIPAALSGIVTGFRGLNNFLPKSYAHRAQPGYTLQGNGAIYLAPGDIATMYDINPLYSAGYDGTGQLLAVMGQTDVYLDDLNYFRSGFGTSFTQITNCATNGNNVITSCGPGNFQYVVIGADPGAPNSQGDDLPEADIDLEWSNAAARGATIVYVNAPETAGGVWDSWYYAVDNELAPVITLSYGLCELGEAFNGSDTEFTFTGDEAELQKANSEGITFMNSSADQGAATCDYQANVAVNGYAVSYPASSPEVTGVGGTLIPYTDYNSTYWNSSNGADGGSLKAWVNNEEAWNDAQEIGEFCTANESNPNCQPNGITNWASAQTAIGIWASGGGVSNCITIDSNSGECLSGFPQPSWQAGIALSTIDPGTPASGVTTSPSRYSPDISLLSSIYWPGYILCLPADELPGFSGTTSTCSPGGAQGIINDQTDYGFSWGGTSVAAPIFAGIVTILNQYAVANGIQSSPGFGNINPALYLLAATPANGAFHRIATGSDGAYCTAGTPSNQPSALQCPNSGQNKGFLGFDATHSDPTTGYNLVTGLGSVDANNLALAWGTANLFPGLSLVDSSGAVQPVLAGQTASGYSFTVAPAGGATTFAAAVAFTCGFLAPDPTLPNSSCTFNPPSIAAGSSGLGGVTVTLSVTTTGPNPNPSKPAQERRRADNRLPWLPLTLPIAGILFAGFAGRGAWRYSAVAGLFVSLTLIGLLVACGGGGGNQTPPPAVSVAVSPSTPINLYANESTNWPTNLTQQQYTATVTNTSNTAVTWSLVQNGTVCTSNATLCGTLSATSGSPVTYTSPTTVPTPAAVTVKATSQADTTKSASDTVDVLRPTAVGSYTVSVTATEAGSQSSLSLSPTLTVQ